MSTSLTRFKVISVTRALEDLSPRKGGGCVKGEVHAAKLASVGGLTLEAKNYFTHLHGSTMELNFVKPVGEERPELGEEFILLKRIEGQQASKEGGVKCVKVSPLFDARGSYITPLKDFKMVDLLGDDPSDEETYTVEIVTLTPDELAALPEFDGF